MISISVIENNFLRRKIDNETTIYPLRAHEFVHFKFSDGTRLVFHKIKNYWHAEVEHVENTSAYTIERKANFNSDIFETEASIVEETIYLEEKD